MQCCNAWHFGNKRTARCP